MILISGWKTAMEVYWQRKKTHIAQWVKDAYEKY